MGLYSQATYTCNSKEYLLILLTLKAYMEKFQFLLICILFAFLIKIFVKLIHAKTYCLVYWMKYNHFFFRCHSVWKIFLLILLWFYAVYFDYITSPPFQPLPDPAPSLYPPTFVYLQALFISACFRLSLFLSPFPSKLIEFNLCCPNYFVCSAYPGIWRTES